jgi:hypothetical protein
MGVSCYRFGPRFLEWYLNLNLNFNGIAVYDFYIGELFLCSIKSI